MPRWRKLIHSEVIGCKNSYYVYLESDGNTFTLHSSSGCRQAKRKSHGWWMPRSLTLQAVINKWNEMKSELKMKIDSNGWNRLTHATFFLLISFFSSLRARANAFSFIPAMLFMTRTSDSEYCSADVSIHHGSRIMAEGEMEMMGGIFFNECTWIVCYFFRWESSFWSLWIINIYFFVGEEQMNLNYNKKNCTGNMLICNTSFCLRE